MLGLYLHIPFCASKCRYCDFYSIKTDDKIKEAYVNALVKQVGEYAIQAGGHTVDTVYIGGGTPTSLDFTLLSKIIKSIRTNFKLQKNAEFTIEANPATVDLAQLKKLHKLGVNRLSIGVQSAIDAELALLGRLHNFDDAKLCVENARKAKFDNISIDVMYGTPNQTKDSLRQTLLDVIALSPEHISLYGLTIEDGTYFDKHKESLNLPDEKTESEMYFESIDHLESKGYKHYEISNFAKNGIISRHNMKYWNLDEYIGLGTGAHSYFANCRYSFVKDIQRFIRHFGEDTSFLDKINIFDLAEYSLFAEQIEIKPHERIGEYVMLQFRLTDGINTNAFAKRFGKDFDSLYYNKLAPFINNKLVLRTELGYRFSRKGMYISNYILSRVIDFE